MDDSNIGSIVKALAEEAMHYPAEAPEKVKEHNRSLTIGIPVESESCENRICLTPESVGVLVDNGLKVVLQSGAGKLCQYSDRLYSDKGAEIAYDSERVFKSEMVLKLNPPTLQELGWMNHGATLLSALQRSQLTAEYLREINRKKITGIGFELIEDKGGLKPVVRSLSEIAANCIISVAGELLASSQNGQGIMFGGVTGVPPMKIVILGAGTIGENVCRIARQMGADVRVFDNHHYKLRRLKKDLGEQVYTSMIDNYTLKEELLTADVVVGCLRAEDGQSLCVVTEDMVMSMKEGAVMIDASISQGGCFETSRPTTHDNPTFVMHDVIHYCVPNISSRVSKTATRALSYLFTPILLQTDRVGGVEAMIHQKTWFMKGVYSYKGCVTNQSLARIYNMDFKDLDLLLATRF